MRKFGAFLLAVVMLFAAIGINYPTNATGDYDEVRVKITTNNATSLSVGVSGDYFIKENSVAFSGGTLTVSTTSDGKVSVSHSSLGTMYTGVSVTIMRRDLDRTKGYLKLNSRYYLGHFKFTRTSNGYLMLVNTVPLAQYLYGVVNREMSNSFPLEALKAQAVAAKGYAICRMSSGGSYDLGDTSSDQVYGGYVASDTRVIQAVDETINDIVLYKGSILRTYFAASNGGETNLPSYAWSASSSNNGFGLALDPYDTQGAPNLVETVTVPVNGGAPAKAELNTLLLDKAAAVLDTELTAIKTISDISMNTPRYANTRHNMTRLTAEMVVLGVASEDDEPAPEYTVNVDMPVSDLLNSRVFTNGSLRVYWGEDVDGGYKLFHARWGHGVGLSQYGAKQRALAGHSYIDILEFYFPGCEIGDLGVTMPANPVFPGTPTQTSAPTSTPTSTPSITDNPDDYTFIGTATVASNTLKLRERPTTSSAIITVLNKGDVLDVIGLSNGWYNVFDPGSSRVGYVSAQYVSYEAAVPTPTPKPTVPPTPTPTPTPTATPSPTPDNALHTAIITANGVNFRSGPSTSSDIIGVLYKGNGLIVFSSSEDWSYVEFNGKKGYVHNDFIQITGEYTAPLPEGAIGRGVTTGRVNFRTGPSTSYSIIKTLAKGTELVLYAKESNGWYEAEIADGTRGFLSGSYVNVTESAGDTGGDDTPDTPMGLGVTTARVNFRTGPSTSAPKIDLLPAGTQVTLYSLRDGWYEAVYAGRRGYLYAAYIRTLDLEDAPSPQPSVSVKPAAGVTTGRLNLRVGPSTSSSVIELLAGGVKLEVLGTIGNWYYVAYKETAGYVNKAYFNITDAGDISIAQVGNNCSVKNTKTSASVNLRTAPSTSNSQVIKLLNKGTAVKVYYKLNDWVLVKVDGFWGFCFADYINI